MSPQEAQSILLLKNKSEAHWNTFQGYLNNRLESCRDQLETSDKDVDAKRLQGQISELRYLLKIDSTAEKVMDANASL